MTSKLKKKQDVAQRSEETLRSLDTFKNNIPSGMCYSFSNWSFIQYRKTEGVKSLTSMLIKIEFSNHHHA